MSLDVYLRTPGVFRERTRNIFIREYGRSYDITREEWDRRFPDREPVMLNGPEYTTDEVFSANITGNLYPMAAEAGLVDVLWHPGDNGIEFADQMVAHLERGLGHLRRSPDHFKAYNPSNNWGTYEGLVEFVEEYLEACKKYPAAVVSVWI